MYFQSILVGIIIIAAIVFAGRSLLQKRDSFSSKAGCGDNCGCNGGNK
ncbi:MAG: FeoB-associated Cys-rich membrane protein [Chloracidobacterium sp.]|nr:FeoB-associated Cys-rich membrane protein [Chloracidobacterium sp.]